LCSHIRIGRRGPTGYLPRTGSGDPFLGLRPAAAFDPKQAFRSANINVQKTKAYLTLKPAGKGCLEFKERSIWVVARLR
jgi:hypothetical protein